MIGIARVTDEEEIFMMTGKGKIQRIKAADIGVIGRNTQGVRIMNVDQGDQLVAVVRVPPEENEEDQVDVEKPEDAPEANSEVAVKPPSDSNASDEEGEQG